MKYVVVRINKTEVPMMFGNDVDLDQVKFPWPIVAAGVSEGINLFFTCQSYQVIGGVEYGSRGLKDEVLLRATDFVGKPNPPLAPDLTHVLPQQHEVFDNVETSTVDPKLLIDQPMAEQVDYEQFLAKGKKSE